MRQKAVGLLIVGVLASLLALGGCTRWFALDARIGVRGAVEGPIPLTVSFTSRPSTGPIVSQTWDFGDPASGPENTSTAETPTHTYRQHGAYVVTLDVFTSDGRSDRATTAIYPTNPPPVPVLEATPDHGPAPLAVTFDLSASADPAGIELEPTGSIVSYSLDFGDGTPPAAGQDLSVLVVHTYTTPEIRTATLTVVDDDGAAGTVSRRIAVEGVVATLSAPGPDPVGLAYGGQSLWVADATAKRIHRLRPADGRVLGSFDAPGAAVVPTDARNIVPGPSPVGTPADLAWDGGSLWVACASDGKIYKLNPNLPTTDPGHIQAVLESADFAAFGLAYGGGALWVSDPDRGRIFRVDPGTGAVLRSLRIPSVSPAGADVRGIVPVAPAGLAWADGALWVTVGAALVRLDPATGATLDVAAAPSPSPMGLAFDGRMLWVCDPRGGSPGRIDRLVVP